MKCKNCGVVQKEYTEGENVCIECGEKYVVLVGEFHSNVPQIRFFIAINFLATFVVFFIFPFFVEVSDFRESLRKLASLWFFIILSSMVIEAWVIGSIRTLVGNFLRTSSGFREARCVLTLVWVASFLNMFQLFKF